MSQQNKPNSSIGQEITERGKNLIEQGNQRRVVIRNQDGNTLVDVTVTTAAVATVLFLIFIPGSMFWSVMLVIAAIFLKLRVEILREVGTGTTVEMKSKRDEEEIV